MEKSESDGILKIDQPKGYKLLILQVVGLAVIRSILNEVSMHQ